MSFWDASALVPLVVRQPQSPGLRGEAERGVPMVVWWGTRVECASAVFRLAREGAIESDKRNAVLSAFGELLLDAGEIVPSEEVRRQAVALLSRYPLRAGDALQLAAALVWCGGAPRGRAFVCLDSRLREAAGTEGFKVLPESEVIVVQP